MERKGAASESKHRLADMSDNESKTNLTQSSSGAKAAQAGNPLLYGVPSGESREAKKFLRQSLASNSTDTPFMFSSKLGDVAGAQILSEMTVGEYAFFATHKAKVKDSTKKK